MNQTAMAEKAGFKTLTEAKIVFVNEVYGEEFENWLKHEAERNKS